MKYYTLVRFKQLFPFACEEFRQTNNEFSSYDMEKMAFPLENCFKLWAGLAYVFLLPVLTLCSRRETWFIGRVAGVNVVMLLRLRCKQFSSRSCHFLCLFCLPLNHFNSNAENNVHAEGYSG